jgi:predicted hotdog family 3-hydroxylacyl-ACP dehydratase
MNHDAAPDAASIDIEQLIPHRLPMRLVESVTSVDNDSIRTTATVRDTWPTARDGKAQTLILIELIAQTAAVLQGWRERNEGKAGIGGLLVGIPEAKVQTPTIPVGVALVCSVRISHGAQNYLAFTGQVAGADGVLWLTGSIQAYRPDDLDTLGGSP